MSTETSAELLALFDPEALADMVVELRAELAHRRVTVTTGGPPPGFHLPGEWRAPDHTPPPDSATTGPATPTREATR